MPTKTCAFCTLKNDFSTPFECRKINDAMDVQENRKIAAKPAFIDAPKNLGGKLVFADPETMDAAQVKASLEKLEELKEELEEREIELGGDAWLEEWYECAFVDGDEAEDDSPPPGLREYMFANLDPLDLSIDVTTSNTNWANRTIREYATPWLRGMRVCWESDAFESSSGSFAPNAPEPRKYHYRHRMLGKHIAVDELDELASAFNERELASDDENDDENEEDDDEDEDDENEDEDEDLKPDEFKHRLYAYLHERAFCEMITRHGKEHPFVDVDSD